MTNWIITYLSSDFLNDNSVGEFVIGRDNLFHSEQEEGTKEYKKHYF